MPAKSINMHGKIYDLTDEKLRTKIQAQKFASEIREKGKVAFLNPIIRKGQETMYSIYQAEKSTRISTRKNVAIETVISELSKGKESFVKWGNELKKSFLEAQKEIPKKETPKKVIPKKIVSKKKSNKKIPKKLTSKKSNKK